MIESLIDKLDRKNGLPEYYKTMCLDGYTNEQIMQAFRKSQRKKYYDMLQEQKDQKELESSIKENLDKTIEKALDEILVEFNK